MKTIIFCNQLARLQVILDKTSEPLRYISLMESHESRKICAYLTERTNAEELPRAELFRERSNAFRQKFVEFIGQVNSANHSLNWWAMPFTNKNPLATDLCRKTFYYLLLIELVRSKPMSLAVITDDGDLATEVEEWGKSEGVSTINTLKAHRTWKGAIKGFTPGAVLFAFLKTLWIWFQVRRFKPAQDLSSRYTVVASLIHIQSLSEPGKYRDVYFGRLTDDLSGRDGKAIVFGLFQERWRDQIPKLRSLRSGIPVIPMEACLSLADILKCGLKALKAYFSPLEIRGPVEIDGLDLNRSVKKAILKARRTGNFFTALKVYYCARGLAKTIGIEKCLYPYENRAFERMLILGIRSVSPETRIVGYQHASVTLSHTNFMLGSTESDVLPLPDTIVTTGPVVKEWMERDGNYPNGVFISGCALRQDKNGQAQPRERRQRMSHVLVTLAASLQEYVNTLIFLEEAFDGSDYSVRIRPHPTIPLEPALEIAPLTRRDFFSESRGSLADSLQWADVVLYASSTVGMEAVSLGIPAVYLDLGDFLDTDPMFGWEEFKWKVADPKELIAVINQIETLPETEYLERQRLGQRYVTDYLSPVNKAGLAAFMEA